MMDTWVKQVGYPLVHVSYNGSTITASQKRLKLVIDQEKEDDTDQLWYIPVVCVDNNVGKTAFILNVTKGTSTHQYLRGREYRNLGLKTTDKNMAEAKILKYIFAKS